MRQWTTVRRSDSRTVGQSDSTAQVLQDALGLPERGLALLRCLLGQSFGGISSS